ncbi:MAG: hypothetical protein WDN04_02465 [Rhodospirillales bacterium]
MGRDRPAARRSASLSSSRPSGSSAPGSADRRRQMAAAAWLLICWPTMALSRPKNRVRACARAAGRLALDAGEVGIEARQAVQRQPRRAGRKRHWGHGERWLQ